MNARSLLLQVPAYAAFAVFIGYFSTSPAYHPIAPDRALVKLSFSHAGERKQACRERTEAELAKLAPNMRAKLDCPRERSPVVVDLEMDGRAIGHVVAQPTGLRGDLPSTVYRRIEIPAGRHAFRARLADGPAGEFRHEARATIDLAPGGVLVVDFVNARAGFEFRH
jgi:hypothetical protein